MCVCVCGGKIVPFHWFLMECWRFRALLKLVSGNNE